jgi:hypothetical protein
VAVALFDWALSCFFHLAVVVFGFWWNGDVHTLAFASILAITRAIAGLLLWGIARLSNAARSTGARR